MIPPSPEYWPFAWLPPAWVVWTCNGITYRRTASGIQQDQPAPRARVQPIDEGRSADVTSVS